MKYAILIWLFSLSASAKYVVIDVFRLGGEEKERFTYTVDAQKIKIWEIRDMVMDESGVSKKNYVLVRRSKEGLLELDADNLIGGYGDYPRSQVLFYVVPKGIEVGKEKRQSSDVNQQQPFCPSNSFFR